MPGALLDTLATEAVAAEAGVLAAHHHGVLAVRVAELAVPDGHRVLVAP